MGNEREYWVDNVKIIACLMVVLGHFSQSMVKSEIIPDNMYITWFNRAIYCFHVQLFFICSGYLFQRYSDVHSIKSWGNNIGKKLMVLGVPYVVFTFASWGLKKVFSSSVNEQVNSLPHILFAEPVPPYWYLYTLFFIFVFTVTAKKAGEIYVLLVVSLICKGISLARIESGIYFIDQTMKHWIWFVCGMALSFGIIKTINVKASILLSVIFLSLSFIYTIRFDESEMIRFLLCPFASLPIISVMFTKYNSNHKIMSFFTRYTMPIFLMHTMFSAAIRSVLLRLGITSGIVQIVLGLATGIFGPIIAMTILELFKPMDFIVYPGRYSGIKKGV